MKKWLTLVSVIILVGTLENLAKTRPSQSALSNKPQQCMQKADDQEQEIVNDDDDDRITKEVLANFVSMLGHFTSIVKDPHNPASVSSGLSGIFIGIINIAQEMFRSGYLSADSEGQELEEFVKMMNKELVGHTRGIMPLISYHIRRMHADQVPCV